MKFEKLPFLISLGLFVTAGFALAATAFSQEAKQSRLDWNMETLVDAYKKVGKTDAKWDEPAIRALTEYARDNAKVTPPDEPWLEIVRTNLDAATKAGCEDPLVRYFYVRYCVAMSNKQVYAHTYCDAALDMQKSSYPDIWKLFSAIHALNQVSVAYGYTNMQAMPMVKEISPVIRQNLLAILQDKTTPLEDVYEACDEGLKVFDFRSDDCIQTYSMIEPTLFTNWPEFTSLLVKGGAYIDLAWNARGGGYAKTVTPEGWITFAKDLAIAENALTNAWNLNTNDARIAVKMMTVELGQGQGRARMELWFRRAMKIDPNDLEACNAKLLYLDPKWHGSVQEMLNFGRECVLNTNWGGRIPLILVDAHNSIYNQYVEKSEKTNYWKQPEVWHEVKTAYDRFFILNPNDTDFYKYYASHAYDAERWASFVELAQKIPARDYYYFSGNDYFDSMVQAANRMIRYNRRHGIVTPQ